MMAMGYALVRSGAMKPTQTRGIALMNLYIVAPCMLISAFQVEASSEVRLGFALAFGAAVVVQLLYILLTKVLAKPLRFDSIESASMIYSNAGNLILPLVSWILGQDMVVYCAAYLVIQTVFMFSHGRSLVRGSFGFDARQIFLNVNMVATYIGAVLFLLNITLPTPVENAISSVGSMIGPASMLVTGMIMGNVNFKEFLQYKRLPLVVLFRLVALPLIALALLKFTPVHTLLPNADMILMIVLLAACAPSASTINQFAQIYDRDAHYASAINVTSILLCIVTMPLMVFLYQL